MMVYELAALAELSLVIVENCGWFRARLPLGGGQIQQIGILFASTFYRNAALHSQTCELWHVWIDNDPQRVSCGL